MIEGYRIDAVHTFQIRTLRALGYDARVALSNASGANPSLATDYRVDVSVYGPSRVRERHEIDVARLGCGEKVLIDCAPFSPASGEAIIIFHLIPLRMKPASDGTVAISRQELYGLFTAQDHYVEYYRGDGFAAGVLYQSGAFNYEKFSRESTTIVQAPKCYVSEDVDTLLSFVNSSLDPEYDRTATLRCCLRDGNGRQYEFSHSIAPFEPALISVKQKLKELGAPAVSSALSFYAFHGLCQTATMWPLTISLDERTGAIGIEHSLPPPYYVTGAVGAERARIVRELAGSTLFSGGH